VFSLSLSLCLVYESVTKNNIPVVLLEGTGGCCDLFAKCSHLYNEYHSNQSELIEHEEQIKSKIREKLQIIESQITTNDYFELMYECIDKRSLFLNFIDIKLHTNVDADIDLVILEALLNGKKLISIEFFCFRNFSFEK